MKVELPALILSAVMSFVLVSPQVWGQPADSNGPVSLQDYLNLAAVNNAELKAEFEKLKAAIEEIPQAKSLEDPRVMYGYATERTTQRSMFEVMQMFPWFGAIEDRTDIATAMAKSGGRQYEAKKLALFYEVKQAFYEYSFLAKAIEITDENLQLMKHFEEVAQTKYAVAEATHPDIIRAQVELATMENDLISLNKSRPAVIARLNSLLNRPAENELPWPQAPPYREVLINFPQVNELITTNNPELQSAAYEIEAAKSSEKLAKKKFYPEFGVGVSVDAGMGENMHHRTMPKIQLTLPIWRSKYKAAERQANAQVMQATQQKVQMENTLAARGQQVLFKLQDSDRKIRLYGDVVIPKVKEMVIASESTYQAGSLDFLSLVDSQRSLIRYQFEYERIVADNAQKLAELEMLTGTQLAVIDGGKISE